MVWLTISELPPDDVLRPQTCDAITFMYIISRIMARAFARLLIPLYLYFAGHRSASAFSGC
jgi:hypothetical protein